MLTPFQSSLVPQPACTPFLGSGWRHPDLRYNQNNAKLSSGNQCGSVSWIRNNIFWTACIFQNNADFTKRPLLPPPACTLWNGSGWRHQDPKYNQNNADLIYGNGKRVLLWDPEQFFLEPPILIRNNADAQSEPAAACIHIYGTGWRHPDPRYSQN